jgi:signal transduction histidine kinase
MIEELTDEIRRIERAAYEKLIRVMSHEVGNSVTATNSLLESSLTYAPELAAGSREEFERALRIAIDRSAELNHFMRRFADVFRLPPVVPEPVDLHALMDTLMALMRAQAPGVRIQWAVRSVAAPLVVAVDRTQFEQACLNILKNAVEAAGPDGTVTVGLATTAAGVELTIEDSGAGPAPEAAMHLFTPFFSTKPQGQGIGLTLVGEILTAHGCAYSLDHHGEGPTRFTIRLPGQAGDSDGARNVERAVR